MMTTSGAIGLLATWLWLVPPAAAQPVPSVPVTHDELARALDDLVGQIQDLGERWRGYFAPPEPPAERPVISLMLAHRQELGLTPEQVQELERLRNDFRREAIKRDADQRVADMDLSALLRAEPVDLGKVEAKVREIEKLRADLRIARIRAIEQGRALLTPDQRSRLAAIVARGGGPVPRPGPPAGSLPPPARNL